MRVATTSGVIDTDKDMGVTTANPRPEPPPRIFTPEELAEERQRETYFRDSNKGRELLDQLHKAIRPAKFDGVAVAVTEARDRARKNLDATLQAVRDELQDNETAKKLAKLDAAIEDARQELEKSQKAATAAQTAYDAEINGESFKALASIAAGGKLTEAHKRVIVVTNVVAQLEGRRDDLRKHEAGASHRRMAAVTEKTWQDAQDELRAFLDKAALAVAALLPGYAECLANTEFARLEIDYVKRTGQLSG